MILIYWDILYFQYTYEIFQIKAVGSWGLFKHGGYDTPFGPTFYRIRTTLPF